MTKGNIDYYIIEVFIDYPVVFVIKSSKLTDEEVGIIKHWCDPNRKGPGFFRTLKTQPDAVKNTLSRFGCIQDEMGCEEHPNPFRESRSGKIIDGRILMLEMVLG